MSKGNFLTNTVSGKMGAMVFFRRKGEQIERSYVKPTNARTRSQYVQRSQLGGLVAFYRTCRTLLNHSFQARPEQQSSYNAFVSANLNKVKVYLPKEISKDQGCVVAPFKVSSGSLQAIEVVGSGDDAITNIAMGQLVVEPTTTIAAFSKALVDNNAALEYGMQLTYVSVVQTSNALNGYPFAQCNLYEITLSENNMEVLSDYMPEQATVNKSGFLAHGAHVANGGYCWIISKKDASGKLLVSPQSLILNDTTLYSEYTGETAANTAARTWLANPDYYLDPGSNSANTSTPAVPMVSSITFNTAAVKPNGSLTVSSEDVIFTVNGGFLSGVSKLRVTVDWSDIGGILGESGTIDVTPTIEGQTDSVITTTFATGLTDRRQVTSITVYLDDKQAYTVALSDGRE